MTDWGRRPPAGAAPKFAEGARVIWHRKTRTGIKSYPATVTEPACWFRRTAEPWGYVIRLDSSPATARFAHLFRYPLESQLAAEPADLELHAQAYACAEDCDTCWYLCSDQTEIPQALVNIKLRAHLASGHRTTSEDDV